MERIKQEYAHLAFHDIGDAFDGAGNLKPIHEMPESIRRSLGGIEVTDLRIDGDGKGPVGKIHKIKILDKRAALRDMAQHMGMMVERVGNPDGTPFIGDVEVRLVRAINGRRDEADH